MRYFIFVVEHERQPNKQVMLVIQSIGYPNSSNIAEEASKTLYPDGKTIISSGWILKQTQEIGQEDFDLLQKPLNHEPGIIKPIL